MRPVLIAGLQGPLDQQGPESGAVDEQVCFQHLSVFEGYAGDKAVLGSLDDLDDLALDPLDPAPFTDLAQIPGEEAGVEMIGAEQAVRG